MMKHLILAFFACAALLVGCDRANLDTTAVYPSKTIEFVIHAGVGGGTDQNARALATPLAEILGTDIAFTSKRGGAGSVAIRYINSRPADGYTLTLLSTAHATTIARGRSSVDADEFVYLGRGTSEPQVLFTRCGRFTSSEDFVSQQKETALSYGITNIGGIDDITALWFTKAGGLLSPRAVPFKSGGEIVTNTIAGNVDVAVLNPVEAQTQVDSGELCPIVVVGSARFSGYPETPTAKELGIDASFPLVRGFAIKAGAPDDVVETLTTAVAEAMQSEFYLSFLERNGLDYKTSVGTAQEFEGEFKALLGDMRFAMRELGYSQ